MMRALEMAPTRTVDAVEHIGGRAVDVVVTIEPGSALPEAGIEDAIIVDDGVPESDWLVDVPVEPIVEQTAVPVSEPEEEKREVAERKRAEMKEARFILERVVAAGKDNRNPHMGFNSFLSSALQRIEEGDKSELSDVWLVMKSVRGWRNEAQEAGKPFVSGDAVLRYRGLRSDYLKEIRDFNRAKDAHERAVALSVWHPNEHPDPGTFDTPPPKKRTVENRYNLMYAFDRATSGKLPF